MGCLGPITCGSGLLASSTYCFCFSPASPLTLLRPGTVFSVIRIHFSCTTTTPQICSSQSIFISFIPGGRYNSTASLRRLPGLSPDARNLSTPSYNLPHHFCGLCTLFLLFGTFPIPYVCKIPDHPPRSSLSDTSSLKGPESTPQTKSITPSTVLHSTSLTMHYLVSLPPDRTKYLRA